MSHRQSTCVPPPSDYTPQPRGHHGQGRQRDKPPRGGGRHHANGPKMDTAQGPSVTFQSEKRTFDPKAVANEIKQPPKDRFHRNDDDDYFARVQDDEYDREQLCDTRDDETKEVVTQGDDEDEEDDPLDAYMKSLENDTGKKKLKTAVNEPDTTVKCDATTTADEKTLQTESQESERAKGVRLDIDETDDIQESYIKYMEEKKSLSDNQEEDERQDLIEYDKDGNVIGVRKIKREIEPLPTLDHSKVEYASFEKCFYREHEEICKLSHEESEKLRAKLEIRVSGSAPPKPVCSFAHFKFDEKLMRIIRKSQYFQPTPIQAQAIPAALLGRNMIGIAMTGSGKTAAYLWPMIVHIARQPGLKQGDGPIGLVLVPTRELALQVYSEAKKFSAAHELTVVCAYGGGSKYEQSRDLEAGAEIVVATPGRIIDLIKSGVTNLRRVTYLVLDEADRFFEMGFEAQVRSICDHIRPDRQTLLFSATFKHRVEQLARTVTEDPVKIIQKTLGEVNEDVSQHIVLFQDAAKKWDWLTSRLVEFTSSGSVLVFVTRILNSEELHKQLEISGREALLLHGDMEQSERNRVITAFKRKECPIMIATDVAARGLDIPHIRTVINYDVARDIDTHIHRVGRTGRAGSKGDAYTLLSTDKDKDFAGHLVKNLEASSRPVDQDLIQLAMRSHTFRKSREKHNRKSSGSHTRPQQHHHHHQEHSQHSSSTHRYSAGHLSRGDGSSSHWQDWSQNRSHDARGSSFAAQRSRSPETRHRIRPGSDDKRPRWQ